MKRRSEIVFILIMAFVGVLPSVCCSGETKTVPGHAHNDYYHPRPLHDALERRFRSVEVDVFLADGDLMVAHSPNEIESGKTLRSLYLEPLRQRIEENDGKVYPDCEQLLLLLIDIKTDGGQAWQVLHRQLAEFADILSVYREGQLESGPVLAVISGSRRIEAMAACDPLYAGVDGRVGEIADGKPPAFMPLVSDHWRRHFTWDGEGAMPADQRAKLSGCRISSSSFFDDGGLRPGTPLAAPLQSVEPDVAAGTGPASPRCRRSASGGRRETINAGFPG